MDRFEVKNKISIVTKKNDDNGKKMNAKVEC